MDVDDVSGLNEVFKVDSLFEYAARYWMVHFYRSSLYKASGGEIALPAEFKKTFPSMVIVPVAEGIVWDSSFITPNPVEMHKLALQVRREVLNEQSEPVLQSLINVALSVQSSTGMSLSHCSTLTRLWRC